jgi:hypothetical protein
MKYRYEFSGRSDAERVHTTPPTVEGDYTNDRILLVRPLSRDLFGGCLLEGYITETGKRVSEWVRRKCPLKFNSYEKN